MNMPFSFTKKETSIYLFQKKLTQILLATLILFSILAGILFYCLERQAYYKSFRESNATIISQIASIYERDIQSLRGLCIQFSLFRQFPAGKYSELSSSDIKIIMDYMTSLNVNNDCVHSIYFYFVEDSTVLSSVSMPTAVSKLDNFYDKAIFSDLEDHQYMLLEPRFLASGGRAETDKMPLVITMLVASPVSANGTDIWMAMNIDARKLYTKIFNELRFEEDVNFYIVDAKDCIIFCNNEQELFDYYENRIPANHRSLVSSTYSSRLGWSFVLERPMPQVDSSLLPFSAVILIILVILLTLSMTTTIFSMRPLQKSLNDSRNVRWRYFLTQGRLPEGSAVTPFLPDIDFPGCRQFVVMSFQLSRPEGNRLFAELSVALDSLAKENPLFFRTIHIDQSRTGVVFGFQREEPSFEKRIAFYTDLANRILNILEGKLKSPVLCSISSTKNTPELLHDAWLEICETERHSLSLTEQIRFWFKIDQKRGDYTFPNVCMKQLVDSLLDGNANAACSHKIFASFLSDDYILENSEIYRHMYYIQNNILSHLAALPVPIQIRAAFSPEQYPDLNQMEKAFNEWLEAAAATVSAQNQKNHVALYQYIIDYLNEHCTNPDICLNMVAEHFELGSNFTSKIIREITGMSFSAYITYSRIQKSKELLAEGKMNINEISAAVGFSYPYYFIRKFKELEGTTPGQYIGQENAPDFSGL